MTGVAGPGPDVRDVIVIGGGIAGLVTAWELTRAGRRPLVLEAGPAVGGCVYRHTVGGLALDAGADSFATARPAVADLIADLGLTGSVVTPNPAGAWVFHEAGAAPLPAGGLLGIPAHPTAADVRRVIGPAGSLRAAWDGLLPGTGTRRAADRDDAGSLGRLVRHRMGNRVLRRLVDPVAGGVYSTDPDRLDLDVVAPGLRAALARTGSLAAAVAALRAGAAAPGSAVAGLAGGMARLTDVLATAVPAGGGEIRCSTTAIALARTATGWAVTIGGPGGGAVLNAAAVVLAVPGGPASRLLDPLVPAGLPPLTTAVPEVLLVTLVLAAPQLDGAPRGTGVLVSAHAAGVRAKALTHATAKWPYLAAAAGPGRHVLRLSYGRARVPREPAGVLDPTQFPDLALADAIALTGRSLDRRSLLDHALVRFSGVLPAPRPGQRQAVDRIRAALAGLPGLAVTGSFLAGTGLASVVADARATALALMPLALAPVRPQSDRPHPPLSGAGADPRAGRM